MKSILKNPSAWIPIVIPLAFFAYAIVHIIIFGIPAREADEGMGAHLFQIWLLLEPFMVGFFAIKWFPRAKKETLIILTLQILAALLPISIVFSLNL